MAAIVTEVERWAYKSPDLQWKDEASFEGLTEHPETSDQMKPKSD